MVRRSPQFVNGSFAWCVPAPLATDQSSGAVVSWDTDHRDVRARVLGPDRQKDLGWMRTRRLERTRSRRCRAGRLFMDVRERAANHEMYAPPTGSFYVLDGANLVYRCYHALARTMGERLDASGDDTQAVFGVVMQLTKLLREQVGHSPLALVLESTGSSSRTAMHPEYKGTRKETPQGVVSSFPYVEALFVACGFPVYKVDGFEGDDIIAELAVQAARAGQKAVIISGDKDFNQLLRQDSIEILKLTNKGCVPYEEADFRREYGDLRPSQFVDLLALMGDTADNIPGVSGIGPKTAQKLVLEYDSVEGIFDNIDNVRPLRTQNLLLAAGRERVILSKALVAFISDGLSNDAASRFKWGDAQLRRAPDIVAVDDIFSRLRIGRKKLDALCTLLRAAGTNTH
ncbi:DNA polymerase I [Porphyridium purpureum]|uniref:DNA polymerase I n=1 Tax=Porphyridium purpureum TaxID=35688 RepID=A0A5J4YW79_PORPP|nr:DNA polymerase I [Porphyridium purpureum]|eukprot:POR7104..scf209_3